MVASAKGAQGRGCFFYLSSVSTVVLAYIVGNSVSAAGLLWLPLPLLGYFRAELAIAFLLLEALLVAMFLACASCFGCCRSAQACSLATAAVFIAAVVFQLVELPGIHFSPHLEQAIESNSFGTGSVHEVPDVFSDDETEQIVSAMWKQRDRWVHITKAIGIPNLIFGHSSNFDEDADPTDSLSWVDPIWSLGSEWTLHFGLKALHGKETQHARHESNFKSRQDTQKLIKDLPSFLPRLRSAIAAHLGIEEGNVVFGQEGALAGHSHIGYPAIQIWLPCFVWRVILNVHQDTYTFASIQSQLQRATGQRCEKKSATTFLVALADPPGAGLRWWSQRSDGTKEEHLSPYRRGSMYTFPSRVIHTINPWNFFDWSLRPRVTVQAFAAKCGDTWYVYH